MLRGIPLVFHPCYTQPVVDWVGTQVRKLRLARKLTQKILADRAGLYHTTISELERGVTIPSTPTLDKIAKALGVTLRELLTPAASDVPTETAGPKK